MANKTVSFRLPEEIIAAIEARAKSVGKTKTDLFIEALCQVYDLDQPESASLTLISLQQQLDGLRQQIEALETLNQTGQNQLQQQTTQVINTLRNVLRPFSENYALPAAQEHPADDPSPDSSQPDSEIVPTPSVDLISVEDQQGQALPELRLLDQMSAEDPGQLAAQAQYQMQVFDKVFAAIPELVFICDRTGHYTYISPLGISVWGVDRSDIIGKKYFEVDLPTEFMDFNLSQFEMVLSFAKISSSEVKVALTNSTRYYDYTLSPIQDDSGIVIGVVGVVVDITQRKQAEISLQDSLERYRMLFEMANDMIFIVDAESYHIIDANLKASRRLRYTRKELCQLKIQDIETPESADHFQSVIVPKLEKVGSAIYTHTFLRKNGDELRVEISVRLIEFGDRLAYQSFAREISERT
jgi:PAS domain S-box-containing protein